MRGLSTRMVRRAAASPRIPRCAFVAWPSGRRCMMPAGHADANPASPHSLNRRDLPKHVALVLRDELVLKPGSGR